MRLFPLESRMHMKGGQCMCRETKEGQEEEEEEEEGREEAKWKM